MGFVEHKLIGYSVHKYMFAALNIPHGFSFSQGYFKFIEFDVFRNDVENVSPNWIQ